MEESVCNANAGRRVLSLAFAVRKRNDGGTGRLSV